MRPAAPDALRILFLNPSAGLGGSERSLFELAAGAHRRGVALRVVLPREGPLLDHFRAAEVACEVVRAPDALLELGRGDPGGILRRLPGLARELRGYLDRLAACAEDFRAGIVHTNGIKSHVLGWRVARRTGAALVWHMRDFLDRGPVARTLACLTRRIPDRIVANSHAVLRHLDLPLGRRLDAHVVYNPIDTRRFRPGAGGAAFRRELGLAPDALLAGIVSAFAPWKGIDVFLRAAALAVRHFPTARFLVVGGEIYDTRTPGNVGMEARLRELVAGLDLGDRVVFTGFREDAAAAIDALDVVVHGSTRPEPFGRVVAEGMACGKAVVATRGGGVLEIIDEGKTGLLVPMSDPGAMAAAMARLLAAPALRRRLGDAARRAAVRRFDTAVHVEAVMEIWRGLAAAQAAPR